jgi:hypothetical protein
VEDVRWLSLPVQQLGLLALFRGDSSAALRHLEEAEILARRAGDRAVLGQALRMLGIWYAKAGGLAHAERLYREALTTIRDLGERWFTPRCLLALAGIAAERQAFARATRLLGAADAAIGGIGGRLYPYELAEQEGYLASARAALGDVAFDIAWAEGQALSREDAVAYALHDDGRSA